ncbi:rna helicase [Holotrichia oblita]|uniref:Rna helicase n=1 Tax=Holotrichia oblita TaxID=644536 RepID=A0ACB9SPP1_HOLOL|nr:rna helicase [Holotrichia oblita]
MGEENNSEDEQSNNEQEGETEVPQENPLTWKDLVNIDNTWISRCFMHSLRAIKMEGTVENSKESIPVALQGKDVIGLAETDLRTVRGVRLGIGVKCAVIVGGMDMMSQALVLAKKPHVLIATPGRLVDHLENTKGFNLRALKFLVMDEADRILNMDFEVEVDKILKVIPRDRRTFLFSATMTKKVKKLQRACLQDPVRVEVSTKYQTVEKLQQYYVFIPVKFKDIYLVHILNELAGNSFMIFCSTCNNTIRTALMLRNLGFTAVPLHGQMSQNKRLAALTKFKAKNRSILISTDVASRGLDIPHVDIVVNFDIPTHSKDYIHRVGRTARAGRSGRAITFVTQYDVELYQRIEELIGKKLPLYKTEEDEVMVLQERVAESQRIAKLEMKDLGDKKKRKKGDNTGDDDDTEGATGVRKRLKKGGMKKKTGRNRK